MEPPAGQHKVVKKGGFLRPNAKGIADAGE
jgi:hypothetical protein